MDTDRCLRRTSIPGPSAAHDVFRFGHLPRSRSAAVSQTADPGRRLVVLVTGGRRRRRRQLLGGPATGGAARTGTVDRRRVVAGRGVATTGRRLLLTVPALHRHPARVGQPAADRLLLREQRRSLRHVRRHTRLHAQMEHYRRTVHDESIHIVIQKKVRPLNILQYKEAYARPPMAA